MFLYEVFSMIATLAYTLLHGLARLRPAPTPLSAIAASHTASVQWQPIWIHPGEVVQLCPGEQRIRVLSGRVWVAQAGRERILYAGETLWIGQGRAPAVCWTFLQQPALAEWRNL